jgi:peptide/nickel transport system permease protein/oligopeptide transport system permease protein
MLTYAIRRVLITLPLLLVLAGVSMFVLQLAPGDPAQLMLGQNATDEAIAELRSRWGLDRTLIEQYFLFLSNILQGDLGRSFQTHEPVTHELARTWVNTVQLAVAAMAISIVVGLPIGILTALKRQAWLDQVVRVLILLSVSMPIYWLGLLLIYFFALQLDWFPTSGMGGPEHIVLPAVSLATFSIAVIVRMTRSSMLEVMSQDYIRTARAKGLGRWRVVVSHALKNALNPVVTMAGLQFGTLLGGAVLTETIFDWPGLGRLLIVALFARDYPIVQGAILLIAVTFIVVNLLVDLIYGWLDPRIRYT